MAAYMLILENHILPKFGESNELYENDVQGFVLEKLEGGLSVKSVKDILIVRLTVRIPSYTLMSLHFKAQISPIRRPVLRLI